MLNKVPTAINRAVRVVVTRHPNRQECLVMRKKVTRAAPGGEEMGGIPTLGGIGVLDTEDEAEVEYEETGWGLVLFTGQYDGTPLNDGDTNPIAASAREAIVEPEQEGAFIADKGDLVMLMPGADIVIPYEVVGVLSTVDIPPYTRKLVLNARDDLLRIPAAA